MDKDRDLQSDMSMSAAKLLGMEVDRVFLEECRRLGVGFHRALLAPLVTIGRLQQANKEKRPPQ